MVGFGPINNDHLASCCSVHQHVASSTSSVDGYVERARPGLRTVILDSLEQDSMLLGPVTNLEVGRDWQFGQSLQS